MRVVVAVNGAGDVGRNRGSTIRPYNWPRSPTCPCCPPKTPRAAC